jgi:hypothetical protein
VRLAWKNLQHQKRHCNTLQAATAQQVCEMLDVSWLLVDNYKTSVMPTAKYLCQSHRGVAEMSIFTLQHLVAKTCSDSYCYKSASCNISSLMKTTGRWRSYNSNLRIAMLRFKTTIIWW